ncbi:DUF3160 domain-containing protein [candidate division KSB1 bacterium]|nr:DUF3160 domain-containing protein [candidate division KSB1 bacterium]
MYKKMFVTFFIAISNIALGQSNFNADDYRSFLQNNHDMSAEALMSVHNLPRNYYSKIDNSTSLDQFSYLDSIVLKYNLTNTELDYLKQHQFVVTERLNSSCFGQAFHEIYLDDLPVFITTDAILHALHFSYDQILKQIEITILEPNLIDFLDELNNSFLQLENKYANNAQLQVSLADVDLYITIARSLLADKKLAGNLVEASTIDAIWDAIQAEQLVTLPLFSDRNRKLDFSQFTVRGHYTQTFYDANGVKRTLGPYFKTMMWLGRMDFLLTPPPENPWELPWEREEIRRMNLGAVLLNELVELSGGRALLKENDDIITFMVGESDNLTPDELSSLVKKMRITNADQLLEDSTYDAFQHALVESADYGQRILSNFFLMDPFSTEPGVLPVSFRLMGQRFIIDSYIFSNVVFDRIIYENNKIWRPMPDPLDAMFALGNNNALPLLQQELNQYHYSSQLAALRYLVDSYDSEFWEQSLYNTWLQAIRQLNPQVDNTGYPMFMNTTAWQQQKLNTQLASWAQLRHDNLLYAKQSYTGGTGCSFPHSFVEPYPEFYVQIANFAEKAGTYFAQFPSTNWEFDQVKSYFDRLTDVTLQLSALAQKELTHQPFNEAETEFLKRMLFVDGGSGAPPFSGWYAELFYIMEDAAKADFVVADVHTQPTDAAGAVVGRILHVGVGKVNLGVFLADAPSDDYHPMAYIGPVMSYHETITENFDRLTDERWTDMVEQEQLPERPDWVNIYLTDKNGNERDQGRELPGSVYTGMTPEPITPRQLTLLQNYPNPFNPATTIRISVPNLTPVTVKIYDVLGREVTTLMNNQPVQGQLTLLWDAQQMPSGMYICRMQTISEIRTLKLMLMR